MRSIAVDAELAVPAAADRYDRPSGRPERPVRGQDALRPSDQHGPIAVRLSPYVCSSNGEATLDAWDRQRDNVLRIGRFWHNTGVPDTHRPQTATQRRGRGCFDEKGRR